MNHQERLLFCKRCTNRKMDLQQGLICNLTGEKANFEHECKEFMQDETVKEMKATADVSLDTNQIKQRLAPEIIEKLKMEQNLMFGIAISAIVGVACAVLWGIITVTTGFQIGYMAVGIGAAVGFTMRKFGKGIDQIFGYWGALLAFLSVALGNFLSIIGFIAEQEGMGLLETLFMFDYSYFPEVMMATFGIMDIVFYGIAIYEGFRFSFRVITDKDAFEMSTIKQRA